MDAVTVEAVQVLLILLPGFVTSWIVLALTVRPSQTDFDKVVEALFYSFTIYALLLFAHLIDPLPIAFVAPPGQAGQAATSTLQAATPTLVVMAAPLRRFVLAAFVLALALGLIVSFLTNHDILTSLFRLLRVTRRTSRISVWNDVFSDLAGWVVIAFSDGRRVRGWPRYFSDTPEEASVYLERAQWLQDDGNPVGNEEQTLLITRNLPIQTVSFLEPAETAQRWWWVVALVVVLAVALTGFFLARNYLSAAANASVAPAARPRNSNG